jgi:hypothetical protein
LPAGTYHVPLTAASLTSSLAAIVSQLKRVQPGGAEGRKTRSLPGVMVGLAARAAAPFWCETTQSCQDLHQLEAVKCLLQEAKEPLTTIYKPVGRLRGEIRVVSAPSNHILDELASRRGVGHIRAAAALFRTCALHSGCPEIGIRDFEIIWKGNKQATSRAVPEKEVGWLQSWITRVSGGSMP